MSGSVTSIAANQANALHELAALLNNAAAGQFPPPDGSVTVLRQPSGRDAGVISFTAHAVIFADTDPGWIRSRLTSGDLSAPLEPRFLHALGEKLSRSAVIDMLTCASALPGDPPDKIELAELPGDAGHEHPRVVRALDHRDEVRVWQADGGVVMIGRGVADRWEVAVEVDPLSRGSGLGRRLALAARHLVPEAAPLWAQIAPGNAASVRAFLHAGFRPVGAEALFSPLCAR